MQHTTPAFEDYLKTIYAHTEWQDDPITPSVLAGKLGVAPSSVTEMVKKLAAAGLVSHVPYGAVRLSELGTERALAVVRRHRLIESWLVSEMGYSWDAVHDEAEVLEHSISDRLLGAIDARLGSPSHDPHGDPIPDASGALRREPFVLLAEATTGHRGRVLRISDRDPELLRLLASLGVGIDSTLTALGDGRFELSGADAATDAAALRLDDNALAAIWVTA